MRRRTTVFTHRKRSVHHRFGKEKKMVVVDPAHPYAPKDLSPCLRQVAVECGGCEVRLHQEKVQEGKKK